MVKKVSNTIKKNVRRQTFKLNPLKCGNLVLMKDNVNTHSRVLRMLPNHTGKVALSYDILNASQRVFGEWGEEEQCWKDRECKLILGQYEVECLPMVLFRRRGESTVQHFVSPRDLSESIRSIEYVDQVDAEAAPAS